MSTSERYWLGFDLGGTKMMAVVYDGSLRVLAREREKTHADEGTVSTLRRAKSLIHAALESAEVSPRRLGGIGIGLPGALDLVNGVVIDAPNLGWKRVPISQILRRTFRCHVSVVNDVDAGIYGEYSLGAARNARCALGIFPGTGIGGGCVYEGALITGGRRSCMEIGHITVVPDGPLCGCGHRGCLEAVAGRLAIASAAAAAAARGAAPNLYKAAGADVTQIRSGALARSIRAGDTVVENIVRHAARMIGKAAAIAINLISPDVIVLGGGLVEAMPALFRREVCNAANAEVMAPYRNTFEVKAARLGDDATAAGAAAWARKLADGTAPPHAGGTA